MQTCESGCLILLSVPVTPAFVRAPPGNVTPHYSTLRCFRKCFCFLFFLDSQNCSCPPPPPLPAIKDTSDWGSVHKCNAIWLIPAIVFGSYKWPNIAHSWYTAWTREFRRNSKPLFRFRVMVVFSVFAFGGGQWLQQYPATPRRGDAPRRLVNG